MRSVARLYIKKLVLWAAPLAGLACGGEGGTDVVLPSLRITTATTGAELDPDGYGVSIDGRPAQPIGLAATLTVDRLTEGAHTVELSGLSASCAVGGENPRTVSVAASATATTAFVITCSVTTGSLQVITTTSGSGTDPDGFALMIDGVDRGAIGVSATATIAGLAPGSHAVALTGLAANCQVAGDNPRAVMLPAGGSSGVAFAVTCATPGAVTGNLQITTVTSGPAQDADGYAVNIDGGTSQPIGPNATLRVANISAAEHTVELRGLAANCAVTGDNPLGVAVDPGGTASVSFAVTCAATAGALGVTISGLPDRAAAAVTVAGPNDFSQAVTQTATLSGLTPGSYAISASDVVAGGTTYTPNVARPAVLVVAGATATVTVTYTAVARITLNLRIDGLYITQSTQTYSSSVPLVAGRDAYLRVFVVANERNTVKPRLRVQFFRNGSLSATRTINAPQGQVPASVDEGALGRSWNLPIEASLIQPGLSVVAEVDGDDAIKESNEADNRFPASGRKSLQVKAVPTAAIRFVRVLQTANNLQGEVGSTDELMSLARRMYPLNTIRSDTRSAVLTVSGPLQPTDANSWGQVLSDLDGARAADPDGSSWTYFGVVKLNYGRQEGIVGQAFQGVPLALGWDDPSDASRVVAHELGHTWGRRHAPCGGPDPRTVDDLYPYVDGRIGVHGMDVVRTDLKPPTSPDIMGYCFSSPWISDYTYRNVMDFRAANSVVAEMTALPQPSLLVWGRVVNGQPVLEPAFQIVARPSLPQRPGPYSVTATGVDGARLLTLSFDVASGQDDPGGGHFAFAVPLDPARASRLGSLRLEGPTGEASSSRTLQQLRTGRASDSILARREGENVSLRWNAAIYPMIMVRDPDTGQVLSFARGGEALVRTSKPDLDLEVSDGVQSQRVRLAISRR